MKMLSEAIDQIHRDESKPMKAAGKLKIHRDLFYNWFRAKGELTANVVEGLNNKAKVATRKSYGFHTENALEIAISHHLGDLPQRKFTHTFW